MLTLISTIILLLSTPSWTTQHSGVTARLRGLSAVNKSIVWASGSNSTVLRTLNGGTSWQQIHVTSDQLDFRDIDAFDANTAYLLSIGNGPASRIYKTIDGGKTWSLQFQNEDPKAFLDAMSFWDRENGLVIGDSIAGVLYILVTSDGGKTWRRVPQSSLPPALENEGAFAASGTNISLVGKSHAWIATGGANRSRVLRTSDRGKTWQVAETPLAAGSSAGAFSIAFRDQKRGVIVGGDYRKETEAANNMAVTEDGGVTWRLRPGLTGYRSVVAFSPADRNKLIATGPSGTDFSNDGGRIWRTIPGPGFDTFSFAVGSNVGWAAGANGRIARLNGF